MRVERLRERLHGCVRASAFDAAELTLQRWSEEHPGDLEPALHASHIRLLQGRYRAAFDAIAGALPERHCPPDVLLDAILCLQEFAAGALMPAVTRGCEGLSQVSADDLARIGSVLLRFGLAEEATQVLQLAGHKAPDAPLPLINRAFLHFYHGNSEQAEVTLERLIAGPQDAAMAHWLLSRQRRQTPAANHVARLRQRLSRTDLHDDDRAYLQFALFKELDDLGQFDSAWQALVEANALLAKLHPYNPTEIEQRFASIKRHFSDAVEAAPESDQRADQHPIPIFIIGMHRSGTSLLEHLLAQSPGLLACGETQRLRAAVAYATDSVTHVDQQAFWSGACRPIDASLAAAHFFALTVGLDADTRFVTEKWPLNFQFVGLIRRIFPDARVIHLCRDPLDLCFANFRERLGDGAAHLNALTDLAHFHAAYRDLMRFWHRRDPGFILDVHYEALVSDPQAQLQRVIAFCGLDPVNPGDVAGSQQRIVATPSAAQVRQPVHRASVGRYRHYAAQLTPLERLLSRNTMDPSAD